MKFFVWLKKKRKKKKKQELNRIQVQLLQKRQTTKPNQISSAPLFTLIHFSFFSLVHTPKSNLSLSLSLTIPKPKQSHSLSLVRP